MCQLVFPLPVDNKYFLSYPSTHANDSPPTVLTQSASSFLSPLHIGHNPPSAHWGIFFPSTEVLIYGSLASCWIHSDSSRCFSSVCPCQKAWLSTVFGVIYVLEHHAPEHNCSPKNAVDFLQYSGLYMKQQGNCGRSEGYGQSQGTALSLLSLLQRCSRLTTCPLGSHVSTEAHAQAHTRITNNTLMCWLLIMLSFPAKPKTIMSHHSIHLYFCNIYASHAITHLCILPVITCLYSCMP